MTDTQGLTEFEIIRRYFSAIGDANISSETGSVALGIGDDCALLNVPAGQQLALSIDTLLADRHFPANANPFDIGQRALAVSISDLAAMGAKPLAFTLALSLPEVDAVWLQGFSQGLAQAAQCYAIPLIGGDTTCGPLSITVQVHGTVANDKSMLRSAAQPGDSIFVSGFLGDAAAALAVIQGRLAVDDEQQAYLLQRFYQPQARLNLGQAIAPLAHAAIDVSDGLLADLGHIVSASSGRGASLVAELQLANIPVSPVLSAVVTESQALNYALSGGDDYELCFTVPQKNKQGIIDVAKRLSLPLAEIGRVVASESSGVRCFDVQGNTVGIAQQGYQHF